MDSLLITSMLICIVLIWLSFSVYATKFHFLTKYADIRDRINVHWSKRVYWYYGFGFFLFICAAPLLALVLVMAKIIIRSLGF